MLKIFFKLWLYFRDIMLTKEVLYNLIMRGFMPNQLIILKHFQQFQHF